MKTFSFVASLVIAAWSVASSTHAQDKPAEPNVPPEVKKLMQGRKYAEAAKAIDKVAQRKEVPLDGLAYLKGRALHLAGQYDDAIAAYEALENEFPKSAWLRRARFGRAVSLARKGDFEAAERIYRQEAAALLSLDRKQEIADIYLEFADAYFKPADERQPPDFAKALEFYTKALAVGPRPEKRAEIELLVARCYQSQGNLQEAANRFAQFLSVGWAPPANDVEARYLLGECQLGLGQHEQARRTWQDLLAAYPNDKSPRIAEAAFNLSRTYNLPAPQTDDELGLGVASLEAFVKRFPEHKLAGQAHLRIAASDVFRGRFDNAVEAIHRFLADERYSDTDEAPEARVLLGRSYQLQKKFPEALEAWRDYLAKYPAHHAWSEVQRDIINTEFLLGYEALQAKRYDEARKLWNEFLAKYPLDGRDPSILYEFGRMAFQQEKYDDALAEWRRLVSKYPGTNESSQAQFMIGVTLEEKLGKLDPALKEYRKVTWGDHAAAAGQRIARLTEKALTIATERVYRGNETPKIKLVSRNIEKVAVRAYTVDLETYFRKMHLAGGVEGLDIALIDPDKSFEFEVPNYAEYQQFENEIEVPLPDEGRSGVMAVTVSGKTLEATTLVVRSDLDVIVKSSRDEVFVFAENLRTKKPWANARLLISNGQQVFAEAATGDDGVFQKSYDELKSAADVRVFAVAEGSVASNVVGLEGVGVSVGLSERGYIFTDRPVYRAGQVVHVRGVVRIVKADRFEIEAGKKYHLEVFDSRDRLIRQDEVALGEFGSFHAHFALPATSTPGGCRIQVRDDDGHAYQGAFAVHEYQLEPVKLAVDTQRKVYYRGEEIEGTITAKFYYGAPLAGRELRYSLAGGRSYSGTTNERGELAFKLPTREFRESQTLPLVVSLAERGLQTSVNFFLATQGFSLTVGTVRPVYVAGETFEVAVSALDAEGKPSAQKLTLHVLERTTVDGKVGEREVEEHELATDEKLGQARLTLRLEQGGQYALRVQGTDRFENPISATHAVQLSDESDRVRLRILADRHTFKVGDTAKVQLHWREAPALALVTFQGAKVLDYQLVALKEGANELEVPLTATLAPNFELAVAVMTDAHPPKDSEAAASFSRFHEASSPFTVERDLRLAIKTKRKAGEGPARPGDDVDVTITATDPQGKPVSAEVSLALVEQALVEMFGSNVAPIQDFFRGQTRAPAVRTMSSVTFAYHPATRPIDPKLLAEKDRLEVAAEEAERLARAHLSQRGGEDARRIAGPAGTAGDALAEESGVPAPADDGPSLLKHRLGEVDGKGALVAKDQPFGSVELNLGLLKPGARVQAEIRAGGTLSRKKLADKKAGKREKLRDSDLSAKMSIDAEVLDVTERELVFGSFEFDDRAEAAAVSPQQLLERPDWRENGAFFCVFSADGTQNNFKLSRDLSDKEVAVLAGKLATQGAVLLPAAAARETAYWNPAVVTDEKGKATVTITLPERTTAWRLLAKGVTAETLAGEADGELVVKKDLFGELKLPLAFTDGDEAEILAGVHNDAVEKGPIEVTLKTTIGGKTVEEKKTLDAGKGIHELSFKTTLNRPDDEPEGGGDAGRPRVTFELTVAAGEQTDVVRREVPLEAYGMPVYATAGGSATSDTTAWVEPPADMPLAAPTLEVIVGPNVESSLLDVLLAPAPRCQLDSQRIASGLDSATSDLMAAVAIQKLLGSTRQAGSPRAEAIDLRIRASISLLVSSQADDGGWSWTGSGGPSNQTTGGKNTSNRYTSARVVWALSLARSAGYKLPDEAFEKALTYLNAQIAATADGDYDSKAVLLQGAAAAGRGDFTLANRLFRNRPSLSNAALAHLALALAQMDRLPMAGDILDVLAQRNLDDAAPKRTAAIASLPWSQAAAELRALYLLAQEKVAPEAAQTRQLVEWLMAHRAGFRWSPDKATGPATLALGEWFAKTRFQGEHYQLTIVVNDTDAATLDVTQDAGTRTVQVPAKLLKRGKQKINFRITGRGRFTYQCVLGGFVPADKLKSTTRDWIVRRHYEPAERELDGQPVHRGFGVLQGSYTAFRNPLTQLPVGRRGRVEIEIQRQNVPANATDEQLEYLVVSEPLPAGATVIEQSISGGFERFEISPGAITFYIGSRHYIEPIRYDIHGYLPGAYRAAPTVIRNPYRPEQLAVAQSKSLAVLPLGAASGDEYQLTPQELYEFGKRQFAKRELAAAGTYLTELVEKWQLQPAIYQEAVTMLLDVHLEQGPDAAIVRYFELIKEKWPEVELSFEKIMRIGAAYDKIGEYERSFLVFRATVESSFLRETGVAGFLEAQGEFSRSVEVMGRLLAEYPPEPYAAAAQYALAQRVYAYAPHAAADPKLREKKLNRVDLVRQALAMLDDFLTSYPNDPAADQASFSLANALLELKAYREAIVACNLYAERYPASDYLDSFWYVVGYSHFALGEHEQALAMCRKVAEAKRTDRQTGRELESHYKWQAIYILGQVHHSLGQAADAIRQYARVEERFADAKQAIQYFLRKAIALPEVTTIQPGKAVALELKFRNVAHCDVRVYKIDLMKFSLLKRNLAGITGINLAGIRPYHEAVIELGDGKDYRDRARKLPLPLKDEGAYLVVCRGDDLYASGLVLVTPLVVDVAEEASSGEVRATVKDATTDGYVSDVHVKVIGTRNPDFVSGETDLRGVFVAEAIQGASTVIAEAGEGRYAFYRGKLDLGPPLAAATAPAAPQSNVERPPAQSFPAQSQAEQLLESLNQSNCAIQQMGCENLKNLYERNKTGVQAKEAY
ncbi:MAG TPA: tetratricopeptide repeat protein [Pirellulales bacterium]|nr:tetratricopeptide repeat protein [Pirellulales bacterium]